MVYVTKADGGRQRFEKEKVMRTATRMRLPPEAAKAIAAKVEKKIYSGIPTKKILQMIFRYAEEFQPEIKNKIDLREAISILRPKPDFEHFVGLLLKEYGYEVKMNQIVAGKCVEHEIDATATKSNETVLVEVKHHYQFHTYTGVSVFLETQAEFEDLVDGFQTKKNNFNFNKVLVVCNTKISDHAKRYALCKNISHFAWRSPENFGLEAMIEGKKIYPITFMRTLDKKSAEVFGDANIVTLKQLVDTDFNKLWYATELPKEKLQNFVSIAKEILGE